MKKLGFIVFLCVLLLGGALFAGDPGEGPLPAWNTGARSSANVKNYVPKVAPLAQDLYMPAEYTTVEGVLIQFPTGSSYTDLEPYYLAMTSAIIESGTIAYIIVKNDTEKNRVLNKLQNAGIMTGNVEFIKKKYDANWTRDYGPWYAYADGVRILINNEYYDERQNDNAMNDYLSELWDDEIFSTGLHTEGGNFMTDGYGTCWASTGVMEENTGYYHMTEEEIRAVYTDYLNCSGLYTPEPLPNEGTTHIDMFSKILDQDTIIVSYSTQELGATTAEINALDKAAKYYSETPKPDGGQWKIVRIPMTFGDYQYWGDSSRVQYTHTNSTIVNDTVIVPIYGRGTDEEALKIYRKLLPRHNVIGVDSNEMIVWGGSIHCTTMQIPVKDYSECGNGVIDGDEECDGTFVNGQDCLSLGLESGILRCSDDCTFDTTGCNGEAVDEDPDPSDTGDTDPSDTGDTEPTDTGDTEPSDTGDSEPTDTGDTDPSDTGDTDPADTGDTETADGDTDGDVSFDDDPEPDKGEEKDGGCSLTLV